MSYQRAVDSTPPRSSRPRVNVIAIKNNSDSLDTADSNKANQIPGRYNLEIPSDLQPLHKRVCLGLPGINPQHPDQVEDQLTSDKLRTGFFEKYLFKNETAQGCDMMYEQFTDRSKLLNMGNFLCKAILKQRNDSSCTSEAASPSIDKVSLSEESRTSWLNTYTDPNCSLSSLPHTVPHGLRIDKLVRQLEENQCSISHAVWVIRLFVLSEQSHKKLNPTTSTQEWTSQFIRVLERIMVDLLKSSQTEEPFLEKVLKQWDYCTRLSQTLYAQDLLDKKSFLRWIVDVVSASTAKCTFMIPVIMTFLPDLFQSRILCLMMLRSIIPHYEQTLGSSDDNSLNTAFPSFCRGIIEVAMLHAPDVLVAPYLSYPSIITNWDRHISTPNYPHKENIYRVLGINPRPEQIADSARMITSRNKRFTDCPIIEENSPNQFTSTLTNPFEGFGAVSLSTDLVDVVKYIFKDTKPTHSDRIYSIVCNLLAWVAKHGEKDPELKYLVCTVVKIWANAKVVSTSPQPSESPQGSGNNSTRRDCIESALLRYLDQGIEQESANDALLDLFSQLTRQGTFSYSRYLRRAIARGYLNPNFTPTAHRHLTYLSCLPAYAADMSIAQHRKSNLQPPGLAPLHDFDQEQKQLDSLLQRLIGKLPAILGPPSPSLTSQILPTVEDPVSQSKLISPWDSDFLSEIQNASRYIRGEIITYLMQGTMNYVIKDVKIGEDNWRVISKPGTALINVREFALVATVFEVCQEYGALLELCLWILVHTEERTLVPILVDVFRRHQSFLISNGYASVVTAGLWTKHREFKSTVNHLDKTTMLYLLHLATMNSPGSTPEMKNEIESCFHSLIPSRPHNNLSSGVGAADISEYIAELYDPPADSSTLRSRAASLCMRYRNIPGWWGKLFANSTQLVHHRVTSGLELNGNKLVQMVRNYSDLFRFLGDFSLEPPAVLQEWIRPLLLSSSLPSGSPVSTEMMQWFMVYLSFLVSRSICSLSSILKLLLNTIEAILHHSLQQQNLQSSYDHPLLQNSHIFLLIRLLLIHDGSQKNIFGNVELAAQDAFLLDQVRHTIFHSIESLDIPFRLLYQFSLLETLLPSQHPLSEALHSICRDLVSMPWFLKFGKNKTTELYTRYMSDGGSPLKLLSLSSINFSNLDSLISEEVFKKLNPKLMDLFLIILGEEAESTSIHFTLAFRSPPDQDIRRHIGPVSIESFEKDLVLINLYLERLVNGESKANNNKEVASYIKNFFHCWIANPQLPEKLLIHAFEGVPSALWINFIFYAENLLSGELDSPTRDFPNYICHLKSKLTGIDIKDNTKFSNQEILNNRAVMARFKILVQTLLICTKDSCSDENFNQLWNKKKFSFGSRILNELTSFSTSQEIFSIMMHADCTYSQALKHTGNPGGIYEAALQAIYSESDEKSGITIDIVREAIQIRLEILIPLISSLVSQIELTDLLKWIEAIFNIVASPLLLASSPLFDLALDFFSYFMGELPKEVKADVFALLRKIQLSLSSEILADPRILRLFPFEARSSFPVELRNNVLSQSSQPHNKHNNQNENNKNGSVKSLPKVIPNVKSSFNPWEWDKSLVKDNIAIPLSHFTPRSVSSLVRSNPNTDIECGPLLEAHQLEPPPSLPSTPMPSSTATLPRIASTTVHSRTKFATTARSAASPLMSFRSTLSPLAALQNSLLMLSSSSVKQSSPSNSKTKP